MNLSVVLDQPSADFVVDRGEEYPTFNRKTVMREHLEPQGKVMMALAPGTRRVIYLTPDQWTAATLFDGQRSFDDVSRELRRLGVRFSPEALRNFTAQLDDVGFWYRTPQQE